MTDKNLTVIGYRILVKLTADKNDEQIRALAGIHKGMYVCDEIHKAAIFTDKQTAEFYKEDFLDKNHQDMSASGGVWKVEIDRVYKGDCFVAMGKHDLENGGLLQ